MFNEGKLHRCRNGERRLRGKVLDPRRCSTTRRRLSDFTTNSPSRTSSRVSRRFTLSARKVTGCTSGRQPPNSGSLMYLKHGRCWMIVVNFAPNFDTLMVRGRRGNGSTRGLLSLKFLVLSLLFGLPGTGVAPARGAEGQNAPLPSVGPGSSFAIADFDGDQRPDLATVEGHQIGSSSKNYSIEFHLTASGWHAIQLVAPLAVSSSRGGMSRLHARAYGSPFPWPQTH